MSDFMEEDNAELYEKFLYNNIPNSDSNSIKLVVRTVMNSSNGSPDEKLIIMADMLQMYNNEDDILYDEAVGGELDSFDSCHMDNLLKIFPDADLNYLQNVCKKYQTFDFEDLVDVISTGKIIISFLNRALLNTHENLRVVHKINTTEVLNFI